MVKRLPKSLEHERFGPALTLAQFKGSKEEYQRYLAILACIQHTDTKHARTAVGLSRKTFHAALQKFWQEGNISRSPRDTGPSKYTDEVLDKAYDILKQSKELLTFEDLFARVKDVHILDGGSVDRFSAAFKMHVHHMKNETLTVNSKKQLHLLHLTDCCDRYAFCLGMDTWFKDKKKKLEDLIFVDETVHCEGVC